MWDAVMYEFKRHYGPRTTLHNPHTKSIVGNENKNSFFLAGNMCYLFKFALL